jgi:hypothetical protein
MELSQDVAPIPILEIPEERPRKPSAKISKVWKCGHEVNLDWVLSGFRYCPYCGGKYPKNRLNLIARWISYQRWYVSYHKITISDEDMMKA